MPRKSGKLTMQESIFAETYAQTGHAVFSAQQAGYKSSGAASTQLSKPEVQENIRVRQLARLDNELLPLALDVIREVLVSPKATERGKLIAAGLVLKHTAGATAEGAAAKAPHEMSNDEILERLEQLAQLRRELSERAAPVIDAEAKEAAEPDILD